MGRILGVEEEGHFESAIAQGPQPKFHRYRTRLRSLTASRGSHTESFAHYDRVPAELEATVKGEAITTRALRR